MSKHLIVFCMAFIFCAPAMANTKSYADPHIVFNVFENYCIGALNTQKDAATFALEQKLTPLPKEDALKFAPDGGRVFEIPELKGSAVLTTNSYVKSVCSISIHKIDSQKFKDKLYSFFSQKNGYSLIKEKRDESAKITRTEFLGDVSGPIKVLVTSSDSPRPNGIQVLMTIGRIE